MSKFLLFFCSLLPLGGFVCLSLAAEGQKHPVVYSPPGDPLATSSTVSGSVEGGRDEEAPYLISEGDAPEAEPEKNEEPYPTSPASAASSEIEYQKYQRNIVSLNRACLYVLIAIIATFALHEALVYPKVDDLQEATKAATGGYLPDDVAYDIVLSRSPAASYSTAALAVASLVAAGNFIVRAIRVLLTMKHRKTKNAGEVLHQGEEQQQVDDIGDQPEQVASERERLAESASAGGDRADTGEFANPELGDAIEAANPEVADIRELDHLD